MKTLADIFGVKIEKDMVKKRPMRVEDIDCSSRLETYFKEHNSKVKHGNNKMREEFEKLPEVASHLHNVVFDIGCGEYLPKKMGYIIHEFSAYYLNGALYAFQEQQKKIAVKNELKDLYRKEVDFLRNQTSRAILALYSKNKEDALSILKEAIKE